MSATHQTVAPLVQAMQHFRSKLGSQSQVCRRPSGARLACSCEAGVKLGEPVVTTTCGPKAQHVVAQPLVMKSSIYYLFCEFD